MLEAQATARLRELLSIQRELPSGGEQDDGWWVIEAALDATGVWLTDLPGDVDRLQEAASLSSCLPVPARLVRPFLERQVELQRELADVLEQAAPTPRPGEAKELLRLAGLERAASAKVAQRAARHRVQASALERELADLPASIAARAKRCREDLLDIESLQDEEVTATVRGLLRSGATERVALVLGSFWRRRGETDWAREAETADPENYRRAARVELAFDGEELPQHLDPLRDYGALTESRLDELRADRLAGDRAERALARRRRRWQGMQNLQTCHGIEQAGALTAEILRCPEDFALTGSRLVGDEPEAQELVIPVSASAFGDLTERFDGRDGASLVVRIVPDRAVSRIAVVSPALRLVSADAEGRLVAVNLVCSGSASQATTEAGWRRAAKLDELDLGGFEVASYLEHAPPGPRLAYQPATEGEAPEPGLLAELIGRERCGHPDGQWVATGDEGALRLACSRCRRHALANIPRHRLDQEQQRVFFEGELSERELLKLERRYAILAGVTPPESLTQLRGGGGEGVDLDPARYPLDTQPPPQQPRRRASMGEIFARRP